LAVAVHAARRVELAPREPVAVVGLGAIGQLLVRVLKSRGFECVIAVDLSQIRLEAARRGGADHVVDASAADTVDALAGIVGGGDWRGHRYAQLETVFDCSGAPAALNAGIAGLVRPGGRLVLIALTDEAPQLDLNKLVRREVSAVGCYGYTRVDCADAFALLTAGDVEVDDLITHRLPLDQIESALITQLDANASVKVMVIPRSTP
jgi:2-desacetyl-2-hydroxyethyl bacteriochlorophyllide A dehydrogenase